MKKYSIKPVVIAVLSTFTSYTSTVIAEDLGLDNVEVISTTPVKGVGLPLNKIPAGIQQADQKDFVQQKNITISDYMNQNMLGVNINETQGNPYQPDVNYHGFTASPLVGTPQGLSVYVDGVRVNEAFGDVVNWDLIPMNSISNMALIPGSNPLFGLNTLGGAISVQTKSGRTNQGVAIEAYTGSWGRRVINAEYGGVSEDGSKDFFISGNSFEEDGWRKFSSTRVQQLFSKIGWQDDRTSIHLSLSLADNKMIGNGTQAGSLFNTLGYNSIYTAPDITGNKMGFGNLTFSHYFSNEIQLSGNVYYRHVNTQSINGNTNGDTYAASATPGTPASIAVDNANCLGGDNTGCTGEDIMGMTHQDTYGFTSQLTFMQDLMGMQNQFVAGIGFNHGRVKYKQYNAYGVLSDQLYVNLVPGLVDAANVDLSGTTQTSSVFATDTLSLNDFWHVTASARYNTTRVNNSDHLLPSGPGSLTGHDVYNRLNPSIGVNFTPSKDLTTYASYNESSRAPTTIELGCADPSNPCALPNALAGDPPLKQVVSKTYELGARGALTQDIGWNVDVYHTMNYNDIQFISNQASVQNGTGFFSNVGTTRRQGFDASLNGRVESFTWMVGYSYVDATYQTQLTLPNSFNTSNVNNQITVNPGSYIPAIPKHQLKLRLGYDITSQWNLGSNIFAYSSQYSRGNENNQDTSSAAKVSGYAVVNLFTNYSFNNGWSVFARVNNVFDREYYTLGQLGVNQVSTTTGQFTGNNVNDGFYAPGAPRAGWIGARYEFGARKSVTSYDKD